MMRVHECSSTSCKRQSSEIKLCTTFKANLSSLKFHECGRDHSERTRVNQKLIGVLNLVPNAELVIYFCFLFIKYSFCLSIVPSTDSRSVRISERHISLCMCWCQAASDIHRGKTPSKEIRQTSSSKCEQLF